MKLFRVDADNVFGVDAGNISGVEVSTRCGAGVEFLPLSAGFRGLSRPDFGASVSQLSGPLSARFRGLCPPDFGGSVGWALDT